MVVVIPRDKREMGMGERGHLEFKDVAYDVLGHVEPVR